ncbi:RNA methyltransferase [Halobacteriales archaeon QS_8_69_26]|nr:MAG: RNA methyltransferase [Halobacteriales archaeon QS_8_69_26]
MKGRELARRLADLSGFEDPSPDREQYPTPPELAANLLAVARVQGDLDHPVLDLGAGTGILAIGAALLGAPTVGLELDAGALATARENAARAGLDGPAGDAGRVDWIRADATDPPVCTESPASTVVTNPPFGAQRGNEGADRAFLSVAADVSAVSYSVHNEGSREFVEAFAADEGGTVTHAFRADLPIDRQFEFHTEDRRTIAAEVFRVEWTDRDESG